jgi:hypothetical protein
VLVLQSSESARERCRYDVTLGQATLSGG